MKNALILLSMLVVALLIACGSSPSSNTAANNNASAANGASVANGPNNANSGPVEIKLDPNNMPPGLSASPIIINGNVNSNTKVKKGTTPAPGIPTEAELKKMMNRPADAAPPANAQPMMRSNKKPAATP